MRQDSDGRENARPAGIARGCALLLLLLNCLVFVPGAGAAYPVEMKDDRGAAVRLLAEPRRLVSLAPSLTEIVFFLGQERKLVGVTRYCNYPPAAKTLPRIGGIADPDIERIVAASPDLVLCTTDGNPREKVRALEEMGIPCFAVAPQDLPGIYAAIERIGELLGVPARARREADALRVRAARATNQASDPVPGVLFVVSTQPIIAAGQATFMDELIRLAGGRNAAATFSGRYPRLTVEDLLAVRPDLIFLAAMEGVERFSPEVTRWKEIPAFRDAGVVSLDGDLVTRPGPRMVAALEEVSRAVSAWRRRHAGASMKESRGNGR
ncbi:MAG TPA: cobalamin-binding protein [Candidatus Deferrimicrobiaceae bacterium]|nr:cobalamin-binding protein [Candidatus Deferrimicrobiaceae bacterium]